MTNQDVVNLHGALNQLGHLNGVKFAYGVTKNLSLLAPEIEAITKAAKDYETSRIELAKKFAKKDEQGEPILVRNEYQLEDKKGFEEAFSELQKTQSFLDYQELLKQDSDFVPFKIKLDDVPKEISVAQMYGIRDLVDEDNG